MALTQKMMDDMTIAANRKVKKIEQSFEDRFYKGRPRPPRVTARDIPLAIRELRDFEVQLNSPGISQPTQNPRFPQAQ